MNDIKEQKVEYTVVRKKIKNINIKVKTDCSVIVSAPVKVKDTEIKRLLLSKMDWIINAQNGFKKLIGKKETTTFNNGGILYLFGDKYKIRKVEWDKNNIEIENDNIVFYIKKEYITNVDYIKKLYLRWLSDIAKKTFRKTADKYNDAIEKSKLEKLEIDVRKMKSRWGTCIPKKNKIIFNLSLIKTPMETIEYVVLHEISHFKYYNHNKSFYNYIETFMPNWKIRREILNKEYIVI